MSPQHHLEHAKSLSMTSQKGELSHLRQSRMTLMTVIKFEEVPRGVLPEEHFSAMFAIRVSDSFEKCVAALVKAKKEEGWKLLDDVEVGTCLAMSWHNTRF
jgi:hypothetical protein